MQTRGVMCWSLRAGHNRDGVIVYEDVYYTFTEASDNGARLISCLQCGQIYVVDIGAELYECPLPEKLEQTICISCGARLSDTYADYPYKYRTRYGTVEEFEVPYRGGYLLDSLAVPKEFPSIYEFTTGHRLGLSTPKWNWNFRLFGKKN